MTKKLDFQEKWDKLVEILLDSWQYRVLDVELMSNLDFTPTSWKVWKPKFIEKSKIMEISLNQKEYDCLIEYNRKKKIWKIKKYDFEELYEKTKEPYS